MRVVRTIGNNLALLDRFTFKHADLTPLGNQHFDRIAFRRRDRKTTLAFRLFAKRHGTRYFSKNRRLFRLTGLKEIGNARQTAGDVFVTRGFYGNTRHHLTDADANTVVYRHDGVTGQHVLHRRI